MAYVLTTPVMLVRHLPPGAEIGVAFCLGLWGGKLLMLTLEPRSMNEWRDK